MPTTELNPFFLAGLSEPDTGNARLSERSRVLKSAKVVFNDINSSIDCAVRDVSENGTRLNMPSTDGVPDHFILRLEANGSETPCRVIWRHATELGIAFEHVEN